MRGKALNPLEANRLLKDNGFFKVRTNGSHAIYKNACGQMITITTGTLSQKTFMRECKRNGIEV